MVAARGNNSDADTKARQSRHVVVKPEPMDVEYTEDSVLPFGSLGGTVAKKRSLGGKVDEDNHGDSTECSSSFGDSGFLSDDDVESDAGIMEVESPLYSYINVDDAPDVPHIVRKKKVTADWRKFIGPDRWRFQWLELRMKELLSQVAKYDKELALTNHEKYLQMEMIKADNCKSELRQLDLPSCETMERRKRKRHEDSADTSLYIKKHQIFSYYNHENKRSRAENERIGADNELSVIDDDIKFDVVDTKSSIGSNDILSESKENNVTLKQYSLRKILLAIECIQTRIINLQSDLSEACNKIDHPQKSLKKKGSHGLHKKKTLVRPFGTAQPDEDKITLEMLFGANNALIDPHMEGIFKESVDDVLIDNEAAIEEDFWQFERIKKTAEIYSEPNICETPIIVNKRGPKPKKKNMEKGLNYPNTGSTVFVAVDTRKSQRVRKPRIL